MCLLKRVKLKNVFKKGRLKAQVSKLESENLSKQNKIDELTIYLERFKTQYNELDDQLNAKLSSLQEQNKKLQRSKDNLEAQISLMKKELVENKQKLALAITRLHQQAVKPGIAGGGSQADKLKNEFDNLKKGLFYDASSKILGFWKERDNLITYRSEEFSQIKSILSQRVFIDGMSYFASDKSEVNANVESIMNELILVKGLTLAPLVSQAVQQKIEAVLLRSKGVDLSDVALVKYAETTTKIILQDLQQIRNFALYEDIEKEIRNFAEAGLRLVREVVNDPSSGEFYIPETGSEFDRSLHDTRDEPEGKVKLTICAGYRIPGTVLVKADVVTYVSDTQETLNLPDERVIDAEKQDKSPLNQYQQFQQISHSEEFLQRQNIHAVSFIGKVISKTGVHLYLQPQNKESYHTDYSANYGSNLDFDSWTYSDEMILESNTPDCRWYKMRGQNLWVPGSHIEGQPPNTSKIPPISEEHNSEGNSVENF